MTAEQALDCQDCRHWEDAALPRTFPCFVNLPPEVRTMIYKYALIRGNLFVPSITIQNFHDDKTNFGLGETTRIAYRPFNLRDVELNRYSRYPDFE